VQQYFSICGHQGAEIILAGASTSCSVSRKQGCKLGVSYILNAFAHSVFAVQYWLLWNGFGNRRLAVWARRCTMVAYFPAFAFCECSVTDVQRLS
jgi:hypothetical protein